MTAFTLSAIWTTGGDGGIVLLADANHPAGLTLSVGDTVEVVALTGTPPGTGSPFARLSEQLQGQPGTVSGTAFTLFDGTSSDEVDQTDPRLLDTPFSLEIVGSNRVNFAPKNSFVEIAQARATVIADIQESSNVQIAQARATVVAPTQETSNVQVAQARATVIATIRGSAYGFEDLPELDKPKILNNNIVGVA